MAELEIGQLLLDAVMEEKDLDVLCMVYGLAGWQRDHSQLGVLDKRIELYTCLNIKFHCALEMFLLGPDASIHRAFQEHYCLPK